MALVVLLSMAMLLIFYGNVILSLNTTFFSTHGDGIQSYFNTYYLARYDTSLLYSHSMNYPYGEVSCYTLSQPVMAGLIKFISREITDVTGYTVGILNFLMLSSVLLAAVFLYLLLAGLNLPVYLALPVSVGIAFLSPQIDRFGGHYTLSYNVALPLLFYLLLLIHRRRHVMRYSLITGLVLFVLMTGHVYFAAFYALPILLFWIFTLAGQRKHSLTGYLKPVLYITFQLILPIVAFYIITGLYSDLSPDRPSKPYGFLVYKASPESIFLPLWVGYGKFLHTIRNFNYVQWEGVAYVGLTATIGFLVILAGIIKKLLRKVSLSAFQVTDHAYLNGMFWASFLALLLSFGVPFVFGLEFLVDYLGPFQQMRSIGRLSWLFFFMLNIVVFYNLWRWQKAAGRRFIRSLLLVAATTVLFGDVYYYLRHRQDTLNNTFAAWSDYRNTSAENQWVKTIDPDQYQAIIPLPFYHMGSDNYGITPRCEMLSHSCLVSMKTGLPIMAIYLSRASVPQSIRNIALVMEPYREFEILQDLPVKKPFLIVAAKCHEYSPHETNLMQAGVKIDSTDAFYLVHLAYDSLVRIPEKRSQEILHEFIRNKFLHPDTVYLSDPLARVAGISFDNQGTGTGYRGNALYLPARSRSVLFDHRVPYVTVPDHIFSFWFSPIDTDLFPKTRLELEWFDSLGVRYHYDNQMLGHWISTLDGSWGLIEYKFTLAHPGDRFRITVYNTLLNRKKSYLIDELQIRPQNCDVYLTQGRDHSKNNRWFYSLNENSAMMEVPGHAAGMKR